MKSSMKSPIFLDVLVWILMVVIGIVIGFNLKASYNKALLDLQNKAIDNVQKEIILDRDGE